MDEVNISNITSTVRVMDGNALLDAKTLQKIVSAVLEAVREHEAHQKRSQAERRITPGVGYELESEE